MRTLTKLDLDVLREFAERHERRYQGVSNPERAEVEHATALHALEAMELMEVRDIRVDTMAGSVIDGYCWVPTRAGEAYLAGMRHKIATVIA